VSPRLAFAQIYQLKGYGQYGIRGSIVNVPTNLDLVQNVLPRLPHDSSTVAVYLKRKLEYKSIYMSGFVRPNIVMKALNDLCKTPLYKDANVYIKQDWKDIMDSSMNEVPTSNNKNEHISEGLISSDGFEEIHDDQGTDTLIQNILEPEQIFDDDDSIAIAPGENFRPLGLFRDLHSEEYNFPTLFFGHQRPDIKLSYQKIAQAELTSTNRKFAYHITNLFFKTIKILIHFVLSSAWIRMRKSILKSRKPTAAQVSNKKNLENLLKSDIGYRELTRIRTSPDYLDRLRKNVFAMIRQLGPPTFFVTFTTGVNNWPELVQTLEDLYLCHNHNDVKISKDVERPKISELVRMDPVTCARYYDKRMSWFRKLLKKCNSLFGQLEDYFFITEFQSGGYPHDHGLLWIANAPRYGTHSNEEIENFIDKYLTTDRFILEERLRSTQTHQHKQTCRKKGKAVCRFHFPKPPMKKTKILLPLQECDRGSYQKVVVGIFEQLIKMDLGKDISYSDFLNRLDLDENTYIMALRSSLKKPTVFLKRNVIDIRTNVFGRLVGPLWQANTDAQFVLDPYAAASYCTSYLTKVDKSVTAEMKATLEKCKYEQTSDVERVRKMGNSFLNAQQMPAQLAVYLALSLPLHHATRSFQFINTSEEQSRAAILLPPDALKKLEPESTEIFCKSSIDKYRKRPQHLNNICLAQFVANYNINNFKKLGVPKIIRWVNFNLHRDPENHYREQLLLFCPFRGLEESLKSGHASWHTAFDQQQEHIMPVRNQFVYKFQKGTEYSDEWNTLQGHVDEFSKMHLKDSSIDIPLPEAMNKLNKVSKCPISTNIEGIEPYDLSIEKKEQMKARKSGNEIVPNCPDDIISDNEFASLVRQLNSEQRMILDDIIYRKRRNPSKTLFIFLTGGAGTGKTFTLLCIIQYLLRYYNKINLEADPLKQKVMKLGFTGKAAFNIGGSTIHSALGIPLNKSLLELGGLSDERRDNFAKKFGQLRLLVIDEISLVGSRMFAMVDRRMRVIMRAHNDFMGGLDVIVTGDLYQAPPVRDRWIFKPSSDGLNELAPNFWVQRVECLELIQVMRQQDVQFIGILNRFRTAIQTEHDIQCINRLCYRSPPSDMTFPHLFYTNVLADAHNKHVFDNTLGETYKFVAQDVPSETCPPSYKLSDKANLTGGLHAEILLKKDMLVELCAGNHVTHDGLVNGADGIFKDLTSTPESLVWIDFGSPRIGVETRLKYRHVYQRHPNIQSNWTPITQKTAEIQIGMNYLHIVSRVQFPIQLATARTIHRAQGLSLDRLAFNPQNVSKHGLSYTALSRVRSKEQLYLLHPICSRNFHVEQSVVDEMFRLRADAKYKISIPLLIDCQKNNIVLQSLNTRSLNLHYKDVLADPNLMASHVLCLNETRISSLQAHPDLHIALLERFNVLSCYHSHGTIMLFRKDMTLFKSRTSMDSGAEFIKGFFNDSMSGALNIITTYKPPKLQLSHYLILLKDILETVPISCPTFVLGDLNVDMLIKNLQSTTLKEFMVGYNLHLSFSESTTDYHSHLDHIWTNALPSLYASGTLEAYWTDHKPIYLNYKTSNI
jgi:hypothetical protein